MLKCPKSEMLLEFVSIPEEMRKSARLAVKVHAWKCTDCHTKITSLRERWASLYQPEPDVTSSLMRVYAKLQSDETLVLKGWKLEATRPVRKKAAPLPFSWPVSASLAAVVLVAAFSFLQSAMHLWSGAAKPVAVTFSEEDPDYPMAQVRVEDKNTLKVQYVRPQHLQTIEFETDPSNR